MRIISHLVAPRARTASRWLLGTAIMMSRVREEMMGRIMMDRMMPAVRKPTPKFGPVEEACPAEGLEEEGAEDVAHDGDEHKDSPEAVDHAGDGGEELREEGDGRAQGLGAELGNEDCDSKSQGDGDDQREKRGYKRSVDEGEGAEVAGDGVPCLSG